MILQTFIYTVQGVKKKKKKIQEGKRLHFPLNTLTTYNLRVMRDPLVNLVLLQKNETLKKSSH